MPEPAEAVAVDPLESLRRRVDAHDVALSGLTAAVHELAASLKATSEAQWKAIREQGQQLETAIRREAELTREAIRGLRLGQ